MKYTSQSVNKHSTSRSGFSLVEMLIVIALIAIVGTLVVSNVGGMFGKANEDVAKQFVTNALKAPLLKYRIDMGSYPTADDGGLAALLNAPSSKEAKWRGPYVEQLPDDPWGNQYQYVYPGTHNKDGYDLWSIGPPPQADTDIIGNWQ